MLRLFGISFGVDIYLSLFVLLITNPEKMTVAFTTTPMPHKNYFNIDQ
jgi:hypothetical protein